MTTQAKKATSAPKTEAVARLEAEAVSKPVKLTINGIELTVNPMAVQAGPQLRAMQTQNNIWPMFDVLVPDVETQNALLDTLPVSEEVGVWLTEDAVKLVGDIMEQAVGEKA